MIPEKLNLRPLKYPEAFNLYTSLVQNPWTPFEVSMSKDVADWDLISQTERDVFGRILRGFTIMEGIVGENWTSTISKYIPIAEFQLLFLLFGQHESVHAVAYDHLEATLGINSYDAFQQDPIALQKIEKLLTNPSQANIMENLAVFGGCVEGVSLYASFAILLSFNRINKFEGVGSIISWSAVDEGCHSNTAIELFKILQNDYGYEKPVESVIHEYFDEIVNNEIEFISNAFQDIESIPSISKQEAIDYLKYRANLKLIELEYSPKYDIQYKDVERIALFFDSTIEGSVSHDFFAVAQNGSSYTANQNRNSEIDHVSVNSLLNYA